MAKNIEKEILVDNGEKKALAKLFKASYPTVRTALQFKSRTLLAHKIREAAIERGGVMVVVENYKSPTL